MPRIQSSMVVMACLPHALVLGSLNPSLLAEPDSANGSILLWSICLLFFVLVAFGAIAFIRRKLSPNEDFHGEGFTLGDFRRMYKAGKMTEEEFERAKSALLASMQKTPAPPPDDLPGNRSLRSEK